MVGWTIRLIRAVRKACRGFLQTLDSLYFILQAQIPHACPKKKPCGLRVSMVGKVNLSLACKVKVQHLGGADVSEQTDGEKGAHKALGKYYQD